MKILDYDIDLWNKYTDENEEKSQESLSRFIYHACLALGAKKICEAGCNVGNNLSSFPKSLEVSGVDRNKHALKKAEERYPQINFENSEIGKTKFPDNAFDLVFTRGVLIHIPKDEIDDILREFLRISNNWILNLEYYGEDGKMINWKRGDDLLWYRNMKERWSKFNVEIISDNDIPLDIDPGKMRLTLVKKSDKSFKR